MKTTKLLALGSCLIGAGISSSAMAQGRWNQPNSRDLSEQVNVVLDPGERLSLYHLLDLDRAACGNTLNSVEVTARTTGQYGLGEITLVSNGYNRDGLTQVSSTRLESKSFYQVNRNAVICNDLRDLEIVNTGRNSLHIDRVSAQLNRESNYTGRRPDRDRHTEETVTLRCQSRQNRRSECRISGSENARIVDVRLLKRHTQATCRENSTYGASRNGIWVDRGCDATFRVTLQKDRYPAPPHRPNPPHQPNPPHRPPHRPDPTVIERVTCSSFGRLTMQCAINAGAPIEVRLIQQHSGSACVNGKTFGISGNGIWVSNGCRGTFDVVARRYQY